METDDLTPAEARVWRAYPRGAVVDFRPPGPADGNTPCGPEHTIRATVLRRLLLDDPCEEGEIPALRIVGARITGVLDLEYATTPRPVRLSHCHFDAEPVFYGARLRQLNLRGSVLPGLDSASVQVEGVLRLSGCRFGGPVRLGGAQIGGALFLDGADIEAPGTSALQLNHVGIGDGLSAPGLGVRGEVRLTGAAVSGTIDLSHARITAADKAVDAEGLGVEGDLLVRHADLRGKVALRGTRIAGRLDLSDSRLSHPGDTALRASSSTIGELWLRGGPPMDGTLNLRRSQIGVLFLNPETLPRAVLLSGLTYASLTPQEPAERRLPMAERDEDGYVPHAYEQLAAAYLSTGDDRAARLVQLAKQRRHRTTLPWYGRVWGRVQDITVGYGFRPLRAAGWLLSLLAVGSLVYGLHPPGALKADEAPQFNAVFYTLDLLVPVISFGQESAFSPHGWYQWLSYLFVVTGWILATTVVAGVSRSVTRQ